MITEGGKILIENVFLNKTPESVWNIIQKISDGDLVDNDHYIVIDLWANDDRKLDILGGTSQLCKHQHIEFGFCMHCGAFASHIGEEKYWDLYWKHILMISNMLKGYKFIIISHKEIPSYVRGMTVISQRLNFAHSRHNVYFPKDGKYAMVFEPKETALSKYSLTVKNEDIYSYVFRVYRAGAIINPTKKVLQLKIQIPTFTSNKGMSL